MFNEELILILHNRFQKVEEKKQFSIQLRSQYYLDTILTPKKVQKIENLGPESLMNIGAKILNKLLANGIQQYIKRKTTTPTSKGHTLFNSISTTFSE